VSRASLLFGLRLLIRFPGFGPGFMPSGACAGSGSMVMREGMRVLGLPAPALAPPLGMLHRLPPSSSTIALSRSKAAGIESTPLPDQLTDVGVAVHPPLGRAIPERSVDLRGQP